MSIIERNALTRLAAYAALRTGAIAPVAVTSLMILLTLGAFLSVTPQEGEIPARALANTPPYFAQNLPLYNYPTVDIPFNMTIKVADANNDTVNVTWEWGDGTPNATDVTPPAFVPVWVNQTHTWTFPREPGVGDYSVLFLINITLDDGMGGVYRTQRSAYVYVPPNGFPEIGLSAPELTDPNDSTLIVANASDPEGDPLTWTFVFNNSVSEFRTEVYHTDPTAPNETVWNNITYVFGVEGNFTVRLNVSDALPPNQIFPHNISLTVPIKAAYNRMPQVGVIDATPQSLIINATLGYLVVNYSIEAFDPDGDVLSVVWDLGDGSPPITNMSAGGTGGYTFVQQRNYSDPGDFNISVVISDGRAGHNVTIFKEVQITSNNLPPSIVGLIFNYSQNRSYGLPNETLKFEISVSDIELNPIEIVVDFGDNSSLEYYNLTDFIAGNVTLTLNHSYEVPGEYQITVWYTDNRIGLFEHSKYYNITVTIKSPPPIVHEYWVALDYICLSLLILAIMLPITWGIVGMQRRRIREHGGPPSKSALDGSQDGRRRG